MQIWQAIILGAVQGLAEFLPISSSGHLILLSRWLGVNGGGLFFDATLHLGTLIPVFLVFYKEIFSLFRKPLNKLGFLVIATIPAVITGFVLGDLVEGVFYQGTLLSAVLLSATFLLTATELFISEVVSKKARKTLPINSARALAMGVAQGIAIAPGLSRSGTVISSGNFVGIKREDNASFAFLMSIPVILGAVLISGYKSVKNGVAIQVLPILFGTVTAGVTGYIAIKLMLKVIKKANYKWFSLYLVFMAIGSIISKIAFGV